MANPSYEPLNPEPPDPRFVETTTHRGTPTRDGAVDPRAHDFMGPTNAGKANPHGPLVVNGVPESALPQVSDEAAVRTQEDYDAAEAAKESQGQDTDKDKVERAVDEKSADSDKGRKAPKLP